MGYNTVALLLNDNLDIGAKDPDLGKRIRYASLNWQTRSRGVDLDICAFATFENGGSCAASYGSIISQDHADGYQVVIVHGNMGWRAGDADYDKYLGWQALDTMKACLERYGYRVTKQRKPASEKAAASPSEPETTT